MSRTVPSRGEGCTHCNPEAGKYHAGILSEKQGSSEILAGEGVPEVKPGKGNKLGRVRGAEQQSSFGRSSRREGQGACRMGNNRGSSKVGWWLLAKPGGA